ncbi:unnamed protein product (macronuclear) [Paramecium tetraurelia]|uniref:Uncharacterized protein n=1 Tax=Paramecium tetraurelia TaxID=5888 RepID=A0CJT7_PARTE|nr:uncharacterized protein GSPATT00000766001 [Paramecium tetraurelia]CAK71054.1 unnamed protein product [Paramecium tetraurelia]|eukprot:XP_001438451.1 hypothetical protein (macronuclear) [Paramecium tetraurelia strain d4-2]
MNQQHKCQLKTLGYVRNYQSESAPSNIINHTLYHKYAASQNYYFTREINDILGKNRTPATIQFYDDTQFQELGERMKRYYYINEYIAKIKLLTEFYKYHNDLPRFTVHKNLIQILNLYYDKKRKLEYYKIQRQIEYENRNNPNRPPKGIVGDKPIETQTTPQSESSNDSTINNNVENILQDIKQQEELNQEEISKISKIQEDQQSEIIQMLKAFNPQQINNQKNVQKYQVFKKQNPLFKKSLKLDEFALSQSSRTQSKCCNDIRVPLSTRFTTDSVSKVLKTSQERTKENNVQKESLISLFNKYSKLSRARLENKVDQTKETKNSIPEMKQLELKIMKSIKDMGKNTPKSQRNKCVQNNKGLHQILSKVNKADSFKEINRTSLLKSCSNRSIKVTNQLDCYKNQTNFNSVLNPISSSNNPYEQKRSKDKQQSKLKANDLKKLMIYKLEKNSNKEKTQKNIPKLNLQTINNFNNLQTSLTFRTQTSSAQQLTPKPLTVRCRINNLIHWQVKALQQNVNNNSQQK